MHVNIYYLAALGGVLTLAWEILKTYRNSHQKSIKDIVSAAMADLKEDLHATIDPLRTDVAVLKSQVGFLWSDAITTLHHPEPTRYRVDYLLDTLKHGTITKSEIAELKQALTDIIHHEEGTNPAPFKVFPGEQTAASILLHSIDHVTEGEDG